MPRTFSPLDDVTRGDLARVGGKAFNCARLKRSNFPVPDGIVVPMDAPDEALAALTDDEWFETVPAEATFAVRSSGIDEDSAGHSFAGIYDTMLNVGRSDLLEAVRACRRSAASDLASAYRRAQQLRSDGIQIGVLVQRMIAAVTSGVAFTVHPVTGADELVINSAWGLGDALVSGLVEPDEFTIRKRDRVVTSSRIAAKSGLAGATASLTPAQLDELADLLTRIEQQYAAPQDVEWCHDGRQFWILQSRPVTTSRAAPSDEIEWTRANLAEVMPDQMSPQALAAYTDLLNQAERQYMGRLLAPDSVLGPPFKSFHGRLYFNLSQLKRICVIGGSPPAAMLRSLGHSEAIRPEDEVVVRPRLRDLLPCLPDLGRIAALNYRAERLVRRHERAVRAAIEPLSRVDPRSLDDAAVWAVLESWKASAPKHVQVVLVLGSVMFHEATLQAICKRVGFPYERLIYQHLAGGECSVSTQQAIDLVTLADVARREPQTVSYLVESGDAFGRFREALAGTRFLEQFDRFLDRYGHRGRYESDWALPRYREDPAPLLFAVRAHVQTPPGEHHEAVAARQAREAADAWRAFEARLSIWQRWMLLPRARATAARLKRHYVWREQCRSDLTRVVEYLRRWHTTLAGRFAARGWIDRPDEYFLLRFEEIAPAIEDPPNAASLRAIVRQRAAEMEAERPLRMPLLMRESDLRQQLRAGAAPSVFDGDELTGLCVSPGSAEGPVVVMRDPNQFARMTRGAILVAPATDPSWTPLFTLAAGVIVEVGGMLSHASTIAREYGLPALANVKHATTRLRDGEWVRLDATAGCVHRSQKAERKH